MQETGSRELLAVLRAPNVRFGSLADISRTLRLCLLSGVKQTYITVWVNVRL